MNIESQLIRYYVQDDEELKEYLELYEIPKKEHIFLIEKRMSSDVAKLLFSLGHKSKSSLIENCNGVRFLQQCVENEDHKHFHSSFCRDRFCPICSHIKSHKESEMLSNIIESLQKDSNYKNSVLLFATFTQKNVGVGELAGEVDKINKAIKELLKKEPLFKDYYKICKGKKVKRKALCQGTVRHLEITSKYNPKTKRIEFHAHWHILLLVKKSYFTEKHLQWTNKKMQKIWRKYMELDYNPNVDIRLARNKDTINVKDNGKIKVENISELDTNGAIKELCKYSTKETDILKFTEDDEGNISINWNDSRIILGELYKALLHKRILVFTGAFKKTKERLYGKKEADDLINELSEDDAIQIFKDRCKKCGAPVTEHIYLWRNKDRGYVEGSEEFKDTYKKSVEGAIAKKSKKNTNVSDQTNISIPVISQIRYQKSDS